MLTYYREAKDGQILEEGITEAGSMSSFIAAGTAYATHGINMIPFFIYYSMFGFQRIGDLIWAAADCAGQGLPDRRHRRPHHAGRRRLAAPGRPQPAQRHRPFPPCGPTIRPSPTRPTIIVLDGMRRMYEDGEDAIYYITRRQRELRHPPMPAGVEEGIIRGIYKFSTQGRRRQAAQGATVRQRRDPARSAAGPGDSGRAVSACRATCGA